MKGISLAHLETIRKEVEAGGTMQVVYDSTPFKKNKDDVMFFCGNSIALTTV